MNTLIRSIRSEYVRYKKLGQRAMSQLNDGDLCREGIAGGNSVATIGWHISGNLKSRFTEFLTSDGEKPWRQRETEFEKRDVTHTELLQKWEEGWATLLDTLDSLTDADLTRTVRIREIDLTVHEALHRSLSHVAYHVGQIVYVARALAGDSWQYMSIPPGQSESYNQNPTAEKGPDMPA